MKIKFDHTNLTGNFEDMDVYNSNTKDEIIKILKSIEDRVENGDMYGSIFDVNGNKIGDWSIENK